MYTGEISCNRKVCSIPTSIIFLHILTQKNLVKISLKFIQADLTIIHQKILKNCSLNTVQSASLGSAAEEIRCVFDDI